MAFPSVFPVRGWLRWASIALIWATAGTVAPAEGRQPELVLKPCRVAGIQEELRCGTYEVFEDRQTRRGRRLPLDVILLPARSTRPEKAPVFFLSGGPGETNTDFVADFLASALRQDHDIVFVDFRGTGGSHRLACRLPQSDEHLEGYLQTPFAPEIARACRSELEGRADLSLYSTPASVDDLDEVRQALGHDKINLVGGSFGTYAALMYIRAHDEHVRSAYLTSLVTLTNRVPLGMARSSQAALDRLFDQCTVDASCRSAYPTLRDDFAAVRARLVKGPVRTSVRHPAGGAATPTSLTDKAFADAVRVIMYSGERSRTLPSLIAEAKAGNFAPFAETAVNASRGFYGKVPLGLYYAITCNEFVNRIRPDEVGPATSGSFFGAWRVRDQMASCKDWPKTKLPADYFEPFRSDVPVLLVSGDNDPVSPPRWGEAVRSFLPNSVHLVVPGGHVPVSPCTDAIATALFRTGSTRQLDMSCAAGLRPAPFKLPDPGKAKPAG